MSIRPLPITATLALLLAAGGATSAVAATANHNGLDECSYQCMGNDTPAGRTECLKHCPAPKTGGTKKAVPMHSGGGMSGNPRHSMRPSTGRTMRR